MNVVLVLGCHGRKLFKLTMCEGTSNAIVDFRSVSHDKEHIYDYLDSHCKLFDRIATDINKIGNVISHLNKNGVIPNHELETLWDYISMHKKCGLYMYIEPIPE